MCHYASTNLRQSVLDYKFKRAFSDPVADERVGFKILRLNDEFSCSDFSGRSCVYG